MVRVFVGAREKVAMAKRPRQQEEANKRRTERTIQLLPYADATIKSFLYSARGRLCNILRKGLSFFYLPSKRCIERFCSPRGKNSNQSSVHNYGDVCRVPTLKVKWLQD